MRGNKMDTLKKKDWVFQQLSDEISKDIWQKKVKFNETQNEEYLKDIIEKYIPECRNKGIYNPNSINRIVKEIQYKNKRIVIFGAGFQGKRVLEVCKSVNAEVEFFCDNAQNKWHTVIDGIFVISLDELMEKENKEQFAIVVSPESVDVEIKKNLLERGIEEENIYLYSKACLIEENQYFDENIIAFDDDEVFVDGGCLDFGTSNRFLDKMKQRNKLVKKIYSFEPDTINLERCKKKIEETNIKDVELINAGLWDTNTYLEFATNGDGGSRIVESDVLGGNNTVKVVALDNVVKEKVTFIKLDVEGAELKALQGAEKIILRDKPKLAISVYHKMEDMWEIPYYIKNLVPEYKLYIRHYSNCNWETVLYAVVK